MPVITTQAPPFTAPADSAAVAARWPRPVWAALFLLLSLGLYARTLDGWFLSDDVMIGIVLPDGARVDWDHVRRTFATDWGGGSHMGYYRPLVIVTQAIDAALWGLDPRGFRLTNVLLHGLSGFLLFELARGFGLGLPAALVAGLGFVVHPMHVESVAWISGRTDVLATVFVLAMLVVHRRRRASSFRPAFWAAACLLLALASKETAITALPIVVAMDLFLPVPIRPELSRVARAAPMWGAYGATILFYFFIRSAAIGSADARGHSGYLQAWSDPDLLEKNLHSLYLVVTPFNRFQAGDDTSGWLAGCALAGVGLLVAAGAALWRRTLRGDVLAFAAAAFVLGLLPFLNMLAVLDDMVSSRLVYTSTAWVAIALGALVDGAPRIVAWPAAALHLAFYGAMLQLNQVPWVEAGAIIRTVRDRYAEAFGSYAGEPVEGLPQIHKGAYLFLHQASVFARPFIDAPPNLEAVASSRAVYDSAERTLRIEPEPSFGGARRFQEDLERGDWLWPLDEKPFAQGRLKDLEPTDPEPPAKAAFRSTSTDPWIDLPLEEPSVLPRGSRDTAYLLMRPTDGAYPELLWLTRGQHGYAAVRLAPDLEVRDGRLVPVLVDGFAVYSAVLGHDPRWPGLDRAWSLRLDPAEHAGPLEIAFFNVVSKPELAYDGGRP
jgi:hypothetical protein